MDGANEEKRKKLIIIFFICDIETIEKTKKNQENRVKVNCKLNR